ncbi:MAG: carboxyltransferase domain-containing protein [Henriciella sp.]|jgi:KipI family sensor histidine kinase inhibitor
MQNNLVPVPVADDIFELSVANTRMAQALASQLRELEIAEDVVTGIETVSIRFHPRNFDRIVRLLGKLSVAEFAPAIDTEIEEIEITYGGQDGPDFDWVCEQVHLSPKAFIELHTSTVHTVEIIGFTPGFSYISGLPKTVSIPRLDNPRPRVAAGSIGISGAYTGTYALPGPGGWPIIGRTDRTLFDRTSDQPFSLTPGQRVRFKAV